MTSAGMLYGSSPFHHLSLQFLTWLKSLSFAASGCSSWAEVRSLRVKISLFVCSNRPDLFHRLVSHQLGNCISCQLILVQNLNLINIRVLINSFTIWWPRHSHLYQWTQFIQRHHSQGQKLDKKPRIKPNQNSNLRHNFRKMQIFENRMCRASAVDSTQVS